MEQNKYILSSSESFRINLLKFFAIILVVYIHSYNAGIYIEEGSITLNLSSWILFEKIGGEIGRMAVPMFFIISAVLLFKSQRSYQDMIKKKIHSLVIPYLFWNTLWIIIFFILQQFSFTSSFFDTTLNRISGFGTSGGYGWLRAYGIVPIGPIVIPLWFMRDLIVMIVFSPIMKIIIPNCKLKLEITFKSK